MYDIFDDLFEDDFALEGYRDSSDIDTELAFEAAMSLDTSYDPAYEGFGDVMGRIGDAVKTGARNLIRKVKEAFAKLGQWIRDRFAGMRAGAAKGESKTLQRVLKSLDNRVKNASGEDKRRVKEKVDKIKRGIMRAIDSSRAEIEQINKQLTNGLAIFEAMQKVGEQYIKKIRSRMTEGNNTDNTADGNDIKDKADALSRKFEEMDRAIQTAIDNHARSMSENKKMADNKSGDLGKIIDEVVKDKINFVAIQNASTVLLRICQEGKSAAEEFERRLQDERGVYSRKYDETKKTSTIYVGPEDIKSKDLKFDETSKASGNILIHNWYNYTRDVTRFSTALKEIASKLGKKSITASGYASGKNKEFYDRPTTFSLDFDNLNFDTNPDLDADADNTK